MNNFNINDLIYIYLCEKINLGYDSSIFYPELKDFNDQEYNALDITSRKDLIFTNYKIKATYFLIKEASILYQQKLTEIDINHIKSLILDYLKNNIKVSDSYPIVDSICYEQAKNIIAILTNETWQNQINILMSAYSLNITNPNIITHCLEKDIIKETLNIDVKDYYLNLYFTLTKRCSCLLQKDSILKFGKNNPSLLAQANYAKLTKDFNNIDLYDFYVDVEKNIFQTSSTIIPLNDSQSFLLAKKFDQQKK